MRNTFFLKIAIGIIILFGLLLAGFYFYEPVWFKIQEQRLLSDDPATSASAIKALIERGESAIPYIKKWLKSPEERIVVNSCLILEKMPGNLWNSAIEELDLVLTALPSEKTDAVCRLIMDKNYLVESALEKACG